MLKAREYKQYAYLVLKLCALPGPYASSMIINTPGNVAAYSQVMKYKQNMNQSKL